MHYPAENKVADIFGLTPLQEGILFHYLENPESDVYLEQLSLTLKGPLLKGHFQKAWDFVIETNGMLRTVIRWENIKKPVQVMLKQLPFVPRYFDLTNPSTEQEVELEKIKSQDRAEPFDIQQTAFRITLCKLDETTHQMIISNHHILYDGWSNGIILDEFFSAYQALCRGEPLVNIAKASFKEFIRWLQNRDTQSQEKFWGNYLAGYENPSELPVKRKTGQNQINGTGRYKNRLAGHTQEKINDFVKQHKITMATLLYSAWGILMQRYTNQVDVVFGVTVANRSADIKGIEKIVGIFINTLPFRFAVSPHEEIQNVLQQISCLRQELDKYENTPLRDIQKCSGLIDPGELFDIVVVIENYPLETHVKMRQDGVLPILSVQSFQMVERTHYPLSVSITIFDDIEFLFTYHQGYFEECIIHRIAYHLENILTGMIENPGVKMKEIQMLSGDELKTILYDFNGLDVDYPTNKTLHRLVEEQGERTPDRIALIGSASYGRLAFFDYTTEIVCLTYRQLNEQSDFLADLLIAKNVLADNIVGIMMERSVEMIIAIMGILKSGSAYLPIDPEYPQERIDYMLKDSRAKVLITNKSELRNPKPETNPNDQKINVQNKNFEDLMILEFENLNFNSSIGRPCRGLSNFVLRISDCNSSNLAYVIYTSGSTGKPKGVMIQHRSVANFTKGVTAIIPFRGDDRVLSLTTISFDIFGLEILVPLICGSVVVMGGREDQLNPEAACFIIERECISIFQATPSRLKMIISLPGKGEKLKILKSLLVGGEVFPGSLFEKLTMIVPGKIFNMYGPTETTIWSTVKEVSGGGAEALNIGKPIANTLIYILDSTYNPVPICVPGELYIGGDGLARGYLNKPELTAEKFGTQITLSQQIGGEKINKSFGKSRNPFSKGFLAARSMLYHTGDLARWLPDGNIDFLGRIDHQVKIRGFRVEPGEIEQRLMQFNGISEALVTVLQDTDGEKNLCAYIVSPGGVTVSELRNYLARHFSSHMIPAYFISMKALPLTPNGKVDRKSLPAPKGIALDSDVEYHSPQTEIEKQLAFAWETVLGKNKISRDENFFAAGGDSIKAIQIASRLGCSGYIVNVGDILRHPYIVRLALLVTRADARDGEKSVIACKGLSAEYIEQLSLRYPVEDIYALSPAQEGMLYHALHEPSSAYFVQFSFRVYGQLDILLVEKSLEHLFRRHQVFRTVFISEGIERPLQVVLREWKKEFLYSDIRCTAQGRKEKEAAVRAFKEKDKNRSFDLRSDIPPIRIAVIQVDEEEYEFVWSNHHILMDGWCSEILYSEFFQVYLGYLENRPIHLAPVKPYRIYLEWLAEQNHDNPRAYWKDLLNGYNQTVGIPRKRDFQADTKEYIREEFSFSLAKEKITVLEQLAAKNQVTLSVLFQAIWGILLAKYNNSRDIVFGIVVSGRPGDIPGVESMVGVFINTIPVRIRLNDTTTFSKLTQQLQEQAGESEPYHYYSLAEIQAQSALKQNLIDHFLTFLNYPGGELLRKGIKEGETVGRNLDLEITHVESLERSNYNMDVLVYFIDPLTVKLRYNIAVYDSGFMKKLAQHIEEVVDQVTQDNFIRVQDIRVSHDRLAIKISVPLDDGNDFEL